MDPHTSDTSGTALPPVPSRFQIHSPINHQQQQQQQQQQPSPRSLQQRSGGTQRRSSRVSINPHTDRIVSRALRGRGSPSNKADRRNRGGAEGGGGIDSSYAAGEFASPGSPGSSRMDDGGWQQQQQRQPRSPAGRGVMAYTADSFAKRGGDAPRRDSRHNHDVEYGVRSPRSPRDPLLRPGDARDERDPTVDPGNLASPGLDPVGTSGYSGLGPATRGAGARGPNDDLRGAADASGDRGAAGGPAAGADGAPPHKYDHRRRLELQVTPWFWPENKETDRAFTSMALQCEVKMREAVAENAIGQHAVPDSQRTATVCFVLEQIAAADGPLKAFFSALKEEIFLAIYQGYSPDHSHKPGSGSGGAGGAGDGEGGSDAVGDPYGVLRDDVAPKFFEHVPYFDAIERLQAENLALRHEVESETAQNQAQSETIEKLNRMMHELRAQNTRGTMDIAEYKLRNGHLENELSSTRQRVADGAQENDYLRSQLQELVTELNKLAQTRDQLDELSDLKAANQNLAEELTLVMREREFWKERVEHMVPKEDHEAAVRAKNETLRSMYTLKASIKQLQDKYDEVLPIAAEWLEKRDQMTPRPDLESICAEEDILFKPVEGPTAARVRQLRDIGVEYRARNGALMREVEEQKDEIMELRLYLGDDTETAADAAAPSTKQFVGLGTGPEVPKYLRFTGKVRNRNLTLRELELLIRDVWSHKGEYDAHRASTESLGTYFYLYLQKRFGIQSMIAEWGYNVIDALQRFAESSVNCRLFLRILNGGMHEATTRDQDWLLNSYLRAKFERVDHMDEGKSTGTINKKTLFNMLPKVFPDKTKDDILRLKRAVHKDFPGKSVPYPKLWETRADGSLGHFFSVIRELHLEDCDLYARQLLHMIRAAPRDASNKVRLIDVRDCLLSLDPLKPVGEIDAYLARGSGTTLETMTSMHGVDPAGFVENLHSTGLVRRTFDHELRWLERERKKRDMGAKKDSKAPGRGSSSGKGATAAGAAAAPRKPAAPKTKVAVSWGSLPRVPRPVPSQEDLDAADEGPGGAGALSQPGGSRNAGGASGNAGGASASHLPQIVMTDAKSAYSDPRKMREAQEREAMIKQSVGSTSTANAVHGSSSRNASRAASPTDARASASPSTIAKPKAQRGAGPSPAILAELEKGNKK